MPDGTLVKTGNLLSWWRIEFIVKEKTVGFAVVKGWSKDQAALVACRDAGAPYGTDITGEQLNDGDLPMARYRNIFIRGTALSTFDPPPEPTVGPGADRAYVRTQVVDRAKDKGWRTTRREVIANPSQETLETRIKALHVLVPIAHRILVNGKVMVECSKDGVINHRGVSTAP